MLVLKKRQPNLGSFKKGHKHSEETKKKIGKTGKGRKHTEETKKKMGKSRSGKLNWRYGIKLTKEEKKKFSFKGRKHTEKAKKKLSLAGKGRTHTEETKKKMKESFKGRKYSEEHKRERSAMMKKKYASGYVHPMKGFKHSEESKRNMSINTSGEKHPFYGKKRPEELSRKLRESRLSQVFPPQDNKFELAMQAGLREKGIEFETHRMYIKRGLKIYGQPDIFIKPNLCIFLDGDYFHANPSKYPDDFILWRERISKTSGRRVPARTAKMIRERDKQVDKELRTQGYRPERIWLSEFKKDPEKCIQKIIKAIK